MLINPTKEVVMNTKRFMLLSAVLDGFLEDANMAANRETFLWFLNHRAWIFQGKNAYGVYEWIKE